MQHRPPTTVDDPPMGGSLATDYRPVWQILDQARARSFTGEIVMMLEPEVRAYLDNGIVYAAERAGEAPIGERLVAAGVVERSDLHAGAVRIGDVEHLGRLFERRPDIDRDRALVATEMSTEQLITELAARDNCAIRFTAYRHHPAGIHRWFAAPFAAKPEFAPSADRGSVDEYSALPLTDDSAGGQLYVEWDEPVLGLDDETDDETIALADDEVADDLRADPSGNGSTPGADLPDEVADVEAFAVDDCRVVYDEPDDAVPGGPDLVPGEAATMPPIEIIPVIDDEDAIRISDLPPLDDALAADAVDDWVTIPVDDADDVLIDPLVETDGADFRVAVSEPTHDPTPAVEEAHDDAVADAVRRAISAIADATLEWDGDTSPTTGAAPITAEVPVQAPAAVSGSPFAPPTLDTSAEAMYAQLEAAAADAERSSALRRLIGGLRRD
ncbi:MAG: hypothetical protein AAGF73_16595 [Actinomycetota bacterium]